MLAVGKLLLLLQLLLLLLLTQLVTGGTWMQVDNREIPRFWYIDDNEDWELIDPPEYNLNEIKRQRNIYNEVHNLPQLQDDLPPSEHQPLDGHPQTISNLKGKKLETEDDNDGVSLFEDGTSKPRHNVDFSLLNHVENDIPIGDHDDKETANIGDVLHEVDPKPDPDNIDIEQVFTNFDDDPAEVNEIEYETIKEKEVGEDNIEVDELTDKLFSDELKQLAREADIGREEIMRNEADENRAVSPFVVERFEQNGQRLGKKLL